ncbi:uncharacterized protein LOC108094567 isoform X3 [Drosophila ficusphila]|uniref:uncharacterized protein LOC108094567 isoform X3 n=1 Tax=Drosophila ficusphila TaxID=30025 RepID=UPI001C8A087F|nr:uncharacterized protein LOC108094567 isoform X3 [Drosophila ficusphila]
MFKLAFKKFKTKSISPNLAEVINVDTIEDKKDERLESDNNVVDDIGLLDVYGTIQGLQILLI